MIDEQLVRCRPCGYVMKESDLGDVCPACGLPRSVFEPYRQKVSANRLFLLSLDIHPIAIHVSQTFVAMTPVLILFHIIFPLFYQDIIHAVISFFIFLLPFSLLLSFSTGLIDGITRFKTLRTPLLWSKIIYSSLIIVISFVQMLTYTPAVYNWFTILLSLGALACAVKLGLIGKQLINVILPGTYVPRRKKKVTSPVKAKPNVNIDEQPTEN